MRSNVEIGFKLSHISELKPNNENKYLNKDF
jgi:hypothetical protein